MKASEMFQDVLDRLENALDDSSRAKKDLEVASARVRQLEGELKRAEDLAESLRAAQRITETRLGIALNSLPPTEREAFAAAFGEQAKVAAGPEEIPF